MGELSVRPEQPAQRAWRKGFASATAVSRIKFEPYGHH